MHKNPSYRILFAAALLLCACTANEREHYEPDVRLSFDPVLLPAAKSGIAEEFSTSSDIFVDAWEYPANSGLKAAELFLSAETVRFNGEEWLASREILWPTMSHRLAVLASSPAAKAVSANLEEGIHFQGVDVEASQADLLYTELLSGLSKLNGGVVNLPFHHAMCYVDFAMRTNAREGEKVEVTSLSMVSLSTVGDFYSLKDPQWTATGSNHEVQFFSGNQLVGATNTPVGEGMWMIPQLVDSEVKVSLEYTNANDFSLHEWLLSAKFQKRLLPGRHYTITLSFFPDEEELRLDETYLQSL